MHRLVVRLCVKVNTDRHAFVGIVIVNSSQAMREIVRNSAGASHFVPEMALTWHDKIVAKSRASVKGSLTHQSSTESNSPK